MFIPSQRKLRKKSLYSVELFDLHSLNICDVYKFFSTSFSSLPTQLIEHRKYFSQNLRGYGEDAFHSFWFWLFSNYLDSYENELKILEIGVYRGQTATLFAILGSFFDLSVKVTCISPFDNTGDAVSVYPDLNYVDDIIFSAKKFGVEADLSLVTAYSNSNEGIDAIRSFNWNLAYIDGSHDQDIVEQDLINVSSSLLVGGFLVFDDSSLGVKDVASYVKWNGFIGHPGPSIIAQHHTRQHDLCHLLTVGHLNLFVKIR